MTPLLESRLIPHKVNGSTTIYGDIDILIVAGDVDAMSRKKLHIEILKRAMDVYNLPWDAPIELHAISQKEANEYQKWTDTSETRFVAGAIHLITLLMRTTISLASLFS